MPAPRGFARSLALAIVLVGTSTPCRPQSAEKKLGDCWWPVFDVVLSREGDFTRSVYFLSANTGIPSRLEGTWAGFLIDEKTLRKDIKRWISWYIDNYPYLYWDPDAHVFRVDELAKEDGVPTDRSRLPENGECGPPPLETDTTGREFSEEKP